MTPKMNDEEEKLSCRVIGKVRKIKERGKNKISSQTYNVAKT